MISPRFATMFCFVQTDAALSAGTLDLLLGVTVKRSFDRISVDGQLSTSDTVFVQWQRRLGRRRVEPETEDELRFGEAIDCADAPARAARSCATARAPAGRADVVRGGTSEIVERVARAVANSTLVKTALLRRRPELGPDPQAAGMALPGTAPLPRRPRDRGRCRRAAGEAVAARSRRAGAAVERDEVEYGSGCPGGSGETEVFFSDLGHEYVTINAEYTT